MDRLASRLAQIVGAANVLTDPTLTAQYVTDWTGGYVGTTRAVVRPENVAEVAAVIDESRTQAIAFVPQGGNTGLVAVGIPHAGEVVLSLQRMRCAPKVDPLAGQALVPAGTPIEVIQQAAAAEGWAYGVDLASRGSATLGGTIATNAGGLRVLRYGDTRAQLIGVEVVLGDGRIVSAMRGLTRDNAGYHLPSLMAGSEGTLGVVTAALVRLVPLSRERAVALIGFPSVGAAVTATQQVRRASGDVEAIELMTRTGMALVSNVKHLPVPFDVPQACLLIELAGRDAEDELIELVASLDGVTDTAVGSGAAGRRLWTWRESHTEAINTLGPPLKLDVTLPIHALADFIAVVPTLLGGLDPSSVPWFFGHAADGNVHVNITGVNAREQVTEAVLTKVAEFGGSISTEHRIGHAKRRWINLSRSDAEIATMRQIKQALDPDGIINPGVLLSA